MPETPNLQGLVKQQVDSAVKRLYDMVQTLESRVNKIKTPTPATTDNSAIANLQRQIDNLSRTTNVTNIGQVVYTTVNVSVVLSVSDITALPTNYGPDDAEKLVYVEDKAHTLRWTGTGWDWARGDDKSGYYRFSDVDPGVGWHVCDGSTVGRLEANGTLTSIVLPNFTGANEEYLKLSGTTLHGQAAVAPTLTMNPYTPAGTVSGIAGTTTPSVNITVTAGAVPIASQGHTHPAPIFTGTPATLTGTVGTNGEPKHSKMATYYRL